MIFVNKFHDGTLVIVVAEHNVEAFKKLIARGINTWDSAPPDIKEFHDLVINGEILQNYQTESNLKKIEDLSEADFFRLNNAPSKKRHSDKEE